MALSFDIEAKDGRARAGVIHTPHGLVSTPCITLNITPALEKWGFSPSDLTTATDIPMLRNSFWMKCDGTHSRDVGWEGPVMTDSGGFQMVSLGDRLRVFSRGVEFTFDNQIHLITPRSVVINALEQGSDMIMPLDYVVDTTNPQQWRFVLSAIMTAWWHRLSRGIADQHLYYIVQGGLNYLARRISLWDANRQLVGGIPAVAIGGLAGKEKREDMYKMIGFCTERLPESKPRHMLGVCKPIDLLSAIRLGMDTFDGIAATREGRHGRVWVAGGKHFDIKSEKFANDTKVLDPTCDCPVCQSGISRAELRERFKAKDREAIRQLMAHNWHHNYRLVKGARQAIIEGRLDAYIQEYIEG